MSDGSITPLQEQVNVSVFPRIAEIDFPTPHSLPRFGGRHAFCLNDRARQDTDGRERVSALQWHLVSITNDPQRRV